MRINKYLAMCKLGSRRDVENLIINGKIKVNGKVVRELFQQIDPDADEVLFENKPVKYKSDKIYVMLNKPKGYLVSHKDDFSRKTVYELLPNFDLHLVAIGRLDYQSEGLLLLTTDGDFAEKVIHPKYKLPKVYRVICKGRILDEDIEKLQNGVKIETGTTGNAKVFVKKRTATVTQLRITIFEGKKRQIRRMIEAVGSEVIDLRRLQIGDVKLDKLPLGMWRFLTPKEIQSLWDYGKVKHHRHQSDDKNNVTS